MQCALAANWYDNLVFRDPSFSFELIRTLGYVYTQGADIGEVFTTARGITDGDRQAWYLQWLKLADRTNAEAYELQQQGLASSASNAFFRASNYYRTASIYAVTATERLNSTTALQKSRTAFLQAIAQIPFIKAVAIPYDGVLLPAYFLSAEKPQAPLLMVQGGLDGTAEELYFEVGVLARRAGFNVLLFEGPGQGLVLRAAQLTLRPDWHHVITRVLDYAIKLPGIDPKKIALLGLGMGGYLAADACAYEARIKACIANGGVYDAAGGFAANLPASIIYLLNADPSKFNTFITAHMQTDMTANWFFNTAMWALDAKTPAQVMQKLKPYTLARNIQKIHMPMLVVDSVQDGFYSDQAQKMYAQLNCPKTLLRFTAQESAQAHCQMGAIAYSNERILQWLNEQFK
jgi:alpha-beta hydrolase superfamily lysophospholipase